MNSLSTVRQVGFAFRLAERYRYLQFFYEKGGAHVPACRHKMCTDSWKNFASNQTAIESIFIFSQ